MFEQLKDQMQINQFLTGGLILGMLTTILYSLKPILLEIWCIIRRKFYYTVTIEQNTDLYRYLQKWLHEKYPNQFRSVRADFLRVKERDLGNELSEPENNARKREYKEINRLQFYHYNDKFTILKNFRFIKIENEKEKLDSAQTIMDMFFDRYTISGFMAEKVIKEILNDVTEYAIAFEDKTAICLYSHSGEGYWRAEKGINFRNIDGIFLPENIKSKIINDANNFVASEVLYEKRNIPYRRGYLLQGPPGTGKSSLISAMARLLNMNLYTINMKTFLGEAELERAFSDIRGYSIIVIEDIDSYFEGRKAKTKISFSTFINMISGIRSKRGIMLFVTTNHPDMIDAALIRSGRIDMILEIGPAKEKEIKDYLSFFYDRKIDISLNNLPRTIADVENICVQNPNDSKKVIEYLEE